MDKSVCMFKCMYLCKDTSFSRRFRDQGATDVNDSFAYVDKVKKFLDFVEGRFSGFGDK